MDKNVCDNTLVFGSCYARSLKAGRAKWKPFCFGSLILNIN